MTDVVIPYEALEAADLVLDRRLAGYGECPSRDWEALEAALRAAAPAIFAANQPKPRMISTAEELRQLGEAVKRTGQRAILSGRTDRVFEVKPWTLGLVTMPLLDTPGTVVFLIRPASETGMEEFDRQGIDWAIDNHGPWRVLDGPEVAP